MASWKKVAIRFAVVITITQMLGCYQAKKESDKKAEIISQYFISVGLLLNDSQAKDALIGGELAVNNAYYAVPNPLWGTRITGSITTPDGLIVEYDWGKDADGNWSLPSTLNLTFDCYYVDLFYENTDADGIELNGNCHVDFSGGNTSQSLQKRIRHKIFVYLYYYPQPGSTRIIGTPAQSDYTITEITSPDYSMCYTGTFAGRNVIPLVEPGGDGCLP